jgi:calcineurin-like phosphoesterase family protein
MNYFFTADEHYGHKNIIQYTNRPFDSVTEMNETLIQKHNEVVGKNDIVIHAGDFCLSHNPRYVHENFVNKLHGSHAFLKGSHDKWLSSKNYIFEKTFDNYHIVVCHYAMRVWPRSHHGSWNLYGHSHGRITPIGLQMDIGVDTNNFYPYSLEQIIEVMNKKGTCREPFTGMIPE